MRRAEKGEKEIRGLRYCTTHRLIYTWTSFTCQYQWTSGTPASELSSSVGRSRCDRSLQGCGLPMLDWRTAVRNREDVSELLSATSQRGLGGIVIMRVLSSSVDINLIGSWSQMKGLGTGKRKQRAGWKVVGCLCSRDLKSGPFL
ncbi:hypothetical protein CGRA01v4_05083 [Colletotrichum graminicola]|nr:hypothetical protein CGRA01v4_05083 [Colletotrichum graminicola]